MPNRNSKGISVSIDRALHAEITAYLQENNMKMADFITLAAKELLKPPSMEIDPELQAEINVYLEEHGMTMDEFFAQAAQNELHPHIPGIGEKLQAEINAYLEEHDMAMDEFFALAAQDELQPKTSEVEVKEVENQRTFAFQIPESLYWRIKDYLKRHNITQKAFVLGLVEKELHQDEKLLIKQQEGTEQAEEEEQGEALSEDGEPTVSEDTPEVEYGDEMEESPAVGDSEGGFEPEDEEETGEGYAEVEEYGYPEETVQDTPAPGYVEGELGAAVEVAPNFDYGQDEPSGFPGPDDEEETEDFGMNMAM